MSNGVPRVRKAAVAGSFYPADPNKLRREVDAFISNVKSTPVNGRTLALIEPHAGFMYSGQIAAYGYSLLKDTNITRVFVISPSHMEHFSFVSVFDGDAYETPLGEMPVDQDLARQLARSNPGLELSEKGHIQRDYQRKEHALEVQLPFLQSVLNDFKVIPVMMGHQDWDACVALGEALAPLLERPDTLIVASSDLSHFHPYDEACELDSTFCRLLERMDPRRLYDMVLEHRCEACGAGPIVAALVAARQAGANSCRVLHRANSGDVTGDRESVVGYASAVIAADPNQKEIATEDEETDELPFLVEEQAYLLQSVRNAISSELGVPSRPLPHLSSAILDQDLGVFVSLKINGRLRGCVGMIEADAPLRETVAEMGRASAFRDTRFTPLSMEELPLLSVEISVLSPSRLIDDPEEIVVGIHGLVIERDIHRGLLLPQVAIENGWSRETFLQYTCEKASLPRDAWKDPATSIYVFTATLISEEKEFTH